MMKPAFLMLSVCALGACGGTEHADIKKWMDGESKGMKVKVEKIDEPKKFAAQKYESDKAMDPFNNAKIAQLTDDKKGAAKGGGLKPDFRAGTPQALL